MHAVSGQYKSDRGVAVLGQYHRQTPWKVTTGTMAHDCSIEFIDKPPFSPDLAPLDFHLLSNLKKHLIGANNYFTTSKAVMDIADEHIILAHRLCKTRPSSKQVSRYCSDLVKRLWSWGVTKLWRNWKIAGEKCPTTRLLYGADIRFHLPSYSY